MRQITEKLFQAYMDILDETNIPNAYAVIAARKIAEYHHLTAPLPEDRQKALEWFEGNAPTVGREGCPCEECEWARKIIKTIRALLSQASSVDVEQYRREAHKFVGMEYIAGGKCPLPSDLNKYGYAQDQAYLKKLGEMMHHLLNTQGHLTPTDQSADVEALKAAVRDFRNKGEER